MNRFTNSSFWQPSGLESRLDSQAPKSGFASPFGQGLGSFKRRNQVVSTSVVRLLGWSCPTAIIRAIAKFVVSSVQRLSSRHVSHIRVEILEAHPSIADAYSAPAILRKIETSRIGAPLEHSYPRPMDLCPGKSMGFVWRTLMAETSARFRKSSAQAYSSDCLFYAAITPAPELEGLPVRGGAKVFKNYEATESLACQIEALFPAAARLRISIAQLCRRCIDGAAAIAGAFPKAPMMLIFKLRLLGDQKPSIATSREIFGMSHMPIVAGGPSAG